MFTARSRRSGFYANNDISAREHDRRHDCGQYAGRSHAPRMPVCPRQPIDRHVPLDVRNWNWTWGGQTFPYALPTLNESPCRVVPRTHRRRPTGNPVQPITLPNGTLDFWTNNSPVQSLPGIRTPPRRAEAVTPVTTDYIILTNVIGFDVKAWDPTYVDPATGGRAVDLGYNGCLSRHHWDERSARLRQQLQNATVEQCGGPRLRHVLDPLRGRRLVQKVLRPARPGQSVDGLDDGNGITGVVDDIGCQSGENLTRPPYAMPLRGIQVKIRTFEPDSKQVREVTVEQSFLPQ